MALSKSFLLCSFLASVEFTVQCDLFCSLSQTLPWFYLHCLTTQVLTPYIWVSEGYNPVWDWGVCCEGAVSLTLGVVGELLVVRVNTSPSCCTVGVPLEFI